MEIALLSIPLRIAAGKVANVIGEQIGLFADATKDLEEIRDKFQSIEAVLVDAERKQMTDKGVRVWLSKLKGVALDIEDVVEDWQISSAGNREDDDHSKVRNTWLPLTPHFKPSSVFLRRKIAVQVREIRKRLDAIHGDKLMSSFSSSSVGGESETMRVSSDWRQTSSFVDESGIIGRDKEKETLISWLVSDAEDVQQQKDVHVTAIVGVGGMGKTTLAQKIFNDPKVKYHFNQALYWVCVSDVFDVIKLTKAILQEVNRGQGASSLSELNSLQHELTECLRGKRFLLVLDDVWNENDEKWKNLLLPLKSGVEGSRILVTTRSENVAEIMNASPIHRLEGLSDDLSWELFRSRAFPGKKSGEFSEFESMGREIAKKCNGVPLSIKVMGSTMKWKTTTADWKNISQCEMWSLPDVRGGILPVLQISYYNLPPYLKQCFSYCSIYEKDATMFKDELVNLWVAQGFIHPQGNREAEDIGEEYFNGLVARSMFQEIHEDDGGIISCKMHDLLHDLATVITEDESYIFPGNKVSNPQYFSIDGVRHASLFLSEDNASISIASCPAKKLRTLFVNDLHEIRSVHDKLFGQARLLRALVVEHCRGMKVLPKAIRKLKHLRFLDLSWSSIEELPEKAIKKLKLLRHLNLSRSSIVKLPPQTIERLNLLRYLDLSFSKLEKLPDAFEKMEHLRYLDLSWTKLEELPDAFGKMEHLRYLDLSWTKIQQLPESVSYLVNLHTLNLNRCERLKNVSGSISKIVGLRHLCIEDTFELNFLPRGIGKLTSLQSLSRFIVGRDEGECGIDELQELDALQGRLEIERLDRVSEAEQATRAKLCKKQYVRELVLDISSRDRGVEDDKVEERIKLLECLQPHPNLQDLSLIAFSISKLTLPSWIGDPSYSNLSRLYIWGSQNQSNPNTTMPGLGKLPGLRRLDIGGVGVGKLGDEFYYGIGMISSSHDGVGRRRGVAFPKLEHLGLYDLDELEEWELTGEADASQVMPSLRELRVRRCPKLQLLPSHLGVAPLSSSSSSSTIASSEILEESKNSDDEMKPLPLDTNRGLTPLEGLTIRSCQKLQSLPHLLRRLKKLKKLSIRSLKNLESLPDSLVQLESLEHLEIDDSCEWELLLPSLGRLKKLSIGYAKKMESLPDTLGRLASLESLAIFRCNKLKSLPQSLGLLKKLESLNIECCVELESLPDSVQQLSLLQELRIYDCPKLPYENEGRREDWPHISHIKTIVINYKFK